MTTRDCSPARRIRTRAKSRRATTARPTTAAVARQTRAGGASAEIDWHTGIHREWEWTRVAPQGTRCGVLEYYFKSTEGLSRRYPNVAVARFEHERADALTDRLVEVTPELRKLSDASPDKSAARADEPYRRALILIYSRLAATAKHLGHDLSHLPPVDRHAQPCATAQEFIADLDVKAREGDTQVKAAAPAKPKTKTGSTSN